MIKKLFSLVFFVFLLSGCGNASDTVSTSGSQTTLMPMSSLRGGIIKTADSGKTYQSAVVVDAKKNIASVQVLSMASDPKENKTLYIGSLDNGIFVSHNAAETWEHIDSFKAMKVYGIAVSSADSNILYATGVLNKRGKVFKSIDGGKSWSDIYSEPGNDTVIISLALDRRNSANMYIGTSSGVIVKTEDGGVRWRNIQKLDGPIGKLAVDPFDSGTLYVSLFEGKFFASRDGGKTFTQADSNFFENSFSQKSLDSEVVVEKRGFPEKIYTLSVDPHLPGVVYVGTNDGIYRTASYGKEWSRLNIIESSAKFPIKAMSISPFNSSEITYVSGSALYTTTDGGEKWEVQQLSVNAVASLIWYDAQTAGTVYVGFRQ